MTTSKETTPWTLDFDHDGAEDIAVIRDANGDELATSRPFWMPEDGDPIPETLIAMRLMQAAPKLLEALTQIARLQKDGEDGFDLTNDDAVETLHDVIDIARTATG